MENISEPDGLLTASAETRHAPDPAGPLPVVEKTREEAGSGTPREPEENDGYGEFDWPEGYEADPDAIARFAPIARELGLAKEAAQKLANLYVELDRSRNDAKAVQIAETNAKWLREVREHPEFGGANLSRTGENVASLMRRYGSPLLMTQVRQMNVQNWPEMFYFLARVSQVMAEDYSPPSGNGKSSAHSTAQLLFPDLN